MTGEREKDTARKANHANIGVQRKVSDAPRLTEAERKLKMAERSALLMQLSAIEEYLGITRRCKSCGNDL